jgi:hypothetical protein
VGMNLSEVIRRYLGWCPNTPTLRAAPALLVVPSAETHPVQQGGGGAAGSQGRIRHGICIATGSIKALLKEKHLLWFSLLAAIIIVFLIIAEGWNVTHYDYTLPSLIWIPFGDSALIVFDLRLFLIEGICMSCFTLLLAGLIIYRNRTRAGKHFRIRDAFAGVNTHAGTIAALSLAMALVATALFEVSSQSQFTGKIEFAISMAMFYLPYAYYVPNEVFSALFFSFRIMVVNILLFLLALYAVPVIVLENRGLPASLAGSVILMRKTWRELLGCILVFGAIILVVAGVALLIGQSPLLLNHDYDFFLQISRGQVLMTAVCYGFLVACGVLMAVGSTVLGIAVTDLYICGRTDITQRVPPERETAAVAGPSR